MEHRFSQVICFPA